MKLNPSLCVYSDDYYSYTYYHTHNEPPTQEEVADEHVARYKSPRPPETPDKRNPARNPAHDDGEDLSTPLSSQAITTGGLVPNDSKKRSHSDDESTMPKRQKGNGKSSDAEPQKNENESYGIGAIITQVNEFDPSNQTEKIIDTTSSRHSTVSKILTTNDIIQLVSNVVNSRMEALQTEILNNIEEKLQKLFEDFRKSYEIAKVRPKGIKKIFRGK